MKSFKQFLEAVATIKGSDIGNINNTDNNDYDGGGGGGGDDDWPSFRKKVLTWAKRKDADSKAVLSIIKDFLFNKEQGYKADKTYYSVRPDSKDADLDFIWFLEFNTPKFNEMKQKVSDILKRSWTFQKATGFDAAKLDVYLSSNNASMHPHAVISSILGVSGGPIFFNVFYNVFIHASQDELRNEAKVSAYHLYKNEKTKTKDAGLISYSDLIKRQYDAEAESLRLYPSKGNNADKDYGSSANMKIKFANGYISITDSASEVKMTGLMNFIF